MTSRRERLPYEGRRRKLGWFRLQKRRIWGELTAASQYLKRATRESERDFLQGIIDRIKGKSFKLNES